MCADKPAFNVDATFIHFLQMKVLLQHEGTSSKQSHSVQWIGCRVCLVYFACAAVLHTRPQRVGAQKHDAAPQQDSDSVDHVRRGFFLARQ